MLDTLGTLVLIIYNLISNNLQLLYREDDGILLYQGCPRPILLTKHSEHHPRETK